MRLAVQIIREKYQGKVVGINNPVFVNGRGAKEYGNPVKSLSPDLIDAKARSSTEFDNLVDAGMNPWLEEDGKYGHIHKNVVGGFIKSRTLFKVGENYFSGIVNTMLVGRGRLFKDVTQIENITNDIVSSYGNMPKSYFVRDVSMVSIDGSGGNVNTSDG